MATPFRGITVQQPFAAAIMAGVKDVENRHYAVSLSMGGADDGDGADSGLWVAVHVGKNDRWLKNAAVMKRVRKLWPGLPNDDALRKDFGRIVGVCHLCDVAARSEAVARGWGDWVGLPCENEFVWRIDGVIPVEKPFAHRGQLRVWKVDASHAPHLRGLVDSRGAAALRAADTTSAASGSGEDRSRRAKAAPPVAGAAKARLKATKRKRPTAAAKSKRPKA